MDLFSERFREVGERLAGSGSDVDRTWRRFLEQSPEAATMMAEIRMRRASILEDDPPPPEFFPEWTLKDRHTMWADTGDHRITRLHNWIRDLWFQFDPISARKSMVTKGFKPDEIDQVSYWLFLLRLGGPAPGEPEHVEIEQYLEEIRGSTPVT